MADALHVLSPRVALSPHRRIALSPRRRVAALLPVLPRRHHPDTIARQAALGAISKLFYK